MLDDGSMMKRTGRATRARIGLCVVLTTAAMLVFGCQGDARQPLSGPKAGALVFRLGETREQILAKLRAVYPRVKLSPVIERHKESRPYEEVLLEGTAQGPNPRQKRAMIKFDVENRAIAFGSIEWPRVMILARDGEFRAPTSNADLAKAAEILRVGSPFAEHMEIAASSSALLLKVIGEDDKVIVDGVVANLSLSFAAYGRLSYAMIGNRRRAIAMLLFEFYGRELHLSRDGIQIKGDVDN